MLVDINPNIPNDAPDDYVSESDDNESDDNIFRLCECPDCSHCDACFIGHCECELADTYSINWLSLIDNNIIHIIFEKNDSQYNITITQNGNNYTITCNSRYCELMDGCDDVIENTNTSLPVELNTVLKLIDLHGEYSDNIN